METMGRKSFVSAFSCAMLLSSSTWAASLQPGQGDLTINQGQGFQPVNTRVDANVGDYIMVGPAGGATLTYDDGCVVNVPPGMVATVEPISPCASGSYAQAAGSGEGQWNMTANGWVWVAAGSTLAAAIAAGVYYSTTSSNTNQTPASP